MQQALVSSFISKYPGTRSCFILGSTGETGKRLTRNIILSGAFSLVKVIARHEISGEFMPEPPTGVRIEQVIVPDFETIPEDSEILKGCEFGFCALGTTKKQAGGEEQFVKIDHDLTLKMLRLAKNSGCKYLALVSAMGASASSIFLYNQTKGRLENDVIELQFDALRIYRPAMIQVKRKEERLGEEIALIVAPILDFCTLGRMAIKVDALAEALLADALKFGASENLSAEPRLLFIGNKDIKASVKKPKPAEDKSEGKTEDEKSKEEKDQTSKEQATEESKEETDQTSKEQTTEESK